MRKPWPIGALGALTALGISFSTAPANLDAQASGRYALSGNRVAVFNLAGMVEIQAGTGSDVQVDVAIGGPDGEELLVETGPIEGEQTLRVIYPDDRIVYDELGRRSRTEIRVRDDGTFFGGRSRGDRVTIAGSGRGLEAYADLTVSVPPGTEIGIFLGVGEVTASNVDGDILIDVAAASVRTTGTTGTLNVDTGSGSVEVRDATGEVTIDTGSGSVEVNGVRGDRLLVDTGSGSVTGSNLDVPDLDVDTGSGRIDLEAVATNNGRLDTGSGSVRIDLLTDVDQLNVDTGSGSVTVFFPDELGAVLDLESSSGGIDFDVPITVTQFDRSSLRGELGDGRGRIHIDTGSGGIRFVKR